MILLPIFVLVTLVFFPPFRRDFTTETRGHGERKRNEECRKAGIPWIPRFLDSLSVSSLRPLCLCGEMSLSNSEGLSMARKLVGVDGVRER